ncbi:MAG: DNA polymerase III subunit alpha, partial [Bacteroidia bacterium]|nr:DNA polymerase III subunit alpha [Bacteroidia bacterium]
GATAKGLSADKLEKIWTDWEKFAQYAFNKSHSTCYAFVAFQTAYLKAHYPGEYMASVLTHNLSNIDKITFFMDECKRMGVSVLGPDVNESSYQFSVNKAGQIRFGMGAVKGVGEAAVISIVEEREANGPYKSIFDLVRRINLRAANKKTFESLAYAGGFDSFGIPRSTYFFTDGNDNINFLEKAIRYGNGHQEGANSSQVSLFGEESAVEMPEPTIPVSEAWSNLEQLRYEKDVVGFFISGHPLDTYKLEIDFFCFHSVNDVKKIEENKNKELVFGGIVTNVHNGITKTGNPWGKITIEDYNESIDLAFFGEDYVKFKQYMVTGLFLHIRGKISERFRNSGNWEFKVSNIQLLSELRDKMARSITVNVPLQIISDDFIAKFNSIISENEKVQPRNCSLRFKIIDTDENVAVDLPSKRIKVNPNNEFLEMLKENNLEFRLN